MMNGFWPGKAPPFVSAVIPAAGRSTRMGDIDKMFADIGGAPVIARTLTAMERCRSVSEVVLVVPEAALPDYRRLVEEYGFKKVAAVVKGGETRQQSVAAGLEEIDARCAYLLIHDGARPFAARRVIEEAILGAVESGAACAAVAVKDTVKRAGADGFAEGTLPRERLFLAQTPQVFSLPLYREALAAAGGDYTDDCQLLEAMGRRVLLTQGSARNIKITTREDLALALAIWAAWEE